MAITIFQATLRLHQVIGTFALHRSYRMISLKRCSIKQVYQNWKCGSIASFGMIYGNLRPTLQFGDRLRVLDNGGHWAGSTFTGQDEKDDTKGNRRTFEFMFLSRSSRIIPNIQYNDVDVFTYRESQLLNVMLIQRDGDRAQRLGIGVIHEDAWVEANPVPMLIKLE